MDQKKLLPEVRSPARNERASETGSSQGKGPAAEQPAPLLPTLSLPTGGGAIRGIGEKLSVNAGTGTAGLSVPIAVSPGRGGLTPPLSLSYSSGAGNGPFGLGWGLSTLAITRKTDKGLPRYVDSEAEDADDSDTFVLAGAEDLVRAHDAEGDRVEFASGAYYVRRYRPRVEGGFARIERWSHATEGVHWKVVTKDNVTSWFGRSEASRITDGDRIFSWLLDETRDDKGNIVRYTYKAEDGVGVDSTAACERQRFDGEYLIKTQRYLKRVEYGNKTPGTADDWLFQVVFDYGEHDADAPAPDDAGAWGLRPDALSSYRSGFEVRTNRLCRRVLMFHRFDELGEEPCLVRSTDFTYDEGAAFTYLTGVTQAGYIRNETGDYDKATMPTLELGYARPELQDELKAIDPASLEGIRGTNPQWVDLDGEGIPGALIPAPRAWYYKANQGEGHLAPPVVLRTLPVPAELAGGMQSLSDINGDGQLELVQYSPPLAGYFDRTTDGDWKPFATLPNLPRIDWNDPNLRFLDLDGDGFADLLITEHDAFVWYRSRGKEGFDLPDRIARPWDEDEGPAIIFADGTETIQLADMSGDGLVDLVRVRNGEVCYWPNLGYGRFGAKVTLDNSPLFDHMDQFEPKRLRFADVDGSGTSDLIYLHRDGAQLYFNQAGNSFADMQAINAIPPANAFATVAAVDLLGTGTACLVWTHSLAPGSGQQILYVDLLGGKKPHLLTSVVNNLGAETRLEYAPSTKFYLADKAAGTPWITRLSFPVQVVERQEVVDHISQTRLVTRYAYHHGYFDGDEREFRGFARVEQWDAETIGGDKGSGLFAEFPYDLDAEDEELNLPPVRTVTWFHTGVWLERERIEAALAKEYFYEAGLPPTPPPSVTKLPSGLTLQEEREAARALKGLTLRQEIYAEDDLGEISDRPYSVTTNEYEVRRLQEAEGERYAVLLTHPRSTVSYHYERSADDPRVTQELVLAVDDFGQVTQAAAIAYPRRTPEHDEQGKLWCTVTNTTLINKPAETSWYRLGVPRETQAFELTGLTPSESGLFSVEDISTAVTSATELAFEETPTSGLELRTIAREVHTYYANDLSAELAFGELESLALPYQTYKLAFTPGLLANEYGELVTETMLADEGKYFEQDDLWWAPSGRVLFDADHFYLPRESIDPFGSHSYLTYDDYSLLPVEAEDALENVIAVENDYRTLSPVLMTDPNLNRTAVEQDALGMVVKTAVMGKDGASEGDTLDDPTTTLEYDLFAWVNDEQPPMVHVAARERHADEESPWQHSYSYSDGFGREVMKKIQAEPDEEDSPRWVGTGRTVFDNKGNAVKKYEPFFSTTHEFEDEDELVESGVTPILRYDPLGRMIRTDFPDGTYSKVEFDPWRQITWDQNDTLTVDSPWYVAKMVGTDAEERCAGLAIAHAGTPTTAHLDTLGRVFLTVTHNGGTDLRDTRVALDIQGNQLSVTDPRGNMIQKQIFDLLKRPMRTVRADAGTSDEDGNRAVEVDDDTEGLRAFVDVMNKPIYAWNERGFASRNLYDALHRPTHAYVTGPEEDAPEKLVVFTVYGEGHPDALTKNLRTRPHLVFDGAGVARSVQFDFKGNLLEANRQLAVEYHETPDWSDLASETSIGDIETAAATLLETETFTTTSAFDALNRVVSNTTPDGSVTTPTYNEANLLEHVEVNIRGATPATVFVENIDYNARGQRTRVEYGNSSITEYTYDPKTFRVTHLVTTKPGSPPTVFQDLTYEYDPVGNIVEIDDAVSFGNDEVSASGLYEYNALYQLIQAEGREHPAVQTSHADADWLNLPPSTDMDALQRYRQSYSYDVAGNITQMHHVQLVESGDAWTRNYLYSNNNNRLLATSVPGDGEDEYSATYTYDTAGNMATMPHLSGLSWDYADRLRRVNKQVGGDDGSNAVYFTYDAAGQRVRKVYEHGHVEERIYLGGWEIYRKRVSGALDFERETLHVMDDKSRVALIETKTVEDEDPISVPDLVLRFQLDNHLGSSTMELNEDGGVISYEEYHPFGSTSAHGPELGGAKRYRYLGMEKDEETGFAYHGARYYAPWMGRWTSADPSGIKYASNRYNYANGNPVVFLDTDGHKAAKSTTTSVKVHSLNLSSKAWLPMAEVLRQNEGHTQLVKQMQDQVDHLIPTASELETARQQGFKEGVASGFMMDVTPLGDPKGLYRNASPSFTTLSRNGFTKDQIYSYLTLINIHDTMIETASSQGRSTGFLTGVTVSWGGGTTAGVVLKELFMLRQVTRLEAMAQAEASLSKARQLDQALDQLITSARVSTAGAQGGAPATASDLYASSLKLVETLDFSTAPNAAIFYSGPGARARALAFADKVGATPIDYTAGGKALEDLELYKNLPAEQADNIWRAASQKYASQASGKINLFVDKARPDRVFMQTEKPILDANQNIYKSTYHYE